MPSKKALCTDCQQKSTCFSKLGQDELQSADENKVQIHYKKGETITKQGSFVTHVLYVKEGLVKVYKELEEDNNIIYSVLPGGSFVGLSNLFTNEIFQYSVAALASSSICSIDRAILERLVEENGSFAHSVLHAINQEAHHLRQKMMSLTHKPLKGRLADTLLQLSGEIFDSKDFPYKLSRNDLAEFSGMSMMSVVRTMQEFIRNGYVEESQGRIRIMDQQALETISHEL
jgi:CRP-like cAMP-binding protein